MDKLPRRLSRLWRSPRAVAITNERLMRSRSRAIGVAVRLGLLLGTAT